jgi:hypothetical protein
MIDGEITNESELEADQKRKKPMIISRSISAIAITLCLLGAGAFAQTDYPNLKLQAEECNKAFVAGDFGRLVDLTYPKFVSQQGGKAKMIASIEQASKEMKAQGMELISMTVDDPTQVVNAHSELVAVVPVTVKMKVSGGTLVGESFMLGASEDKGKTWTFVSGSSMDKTELKTLFPAAVEKLILPEQKQPTLIATPQQ